MQLLHFCPTTMAQKGDGKKKKKITKQAIIDLLDDNEIDLSMSDLTTTTLPVKELVHIIIYKNNCAHAFPPSGHGASRD